MITDSFNNFGLAAVAISTTLANSESTIPMAKVMLILPLVMQKQTTNYLSHSRTNISGFADLLLHHPEFFTNFALRYEVALPTSFNAILMLCEIGSARLANDGMYYVKPLDKLELMGERAHRIGKAAKNIALMLTAPVEELYLNLRIKL